jgi:predicted nucleic acid-binding protein
MAIVFDSSILVAALDATSEFHAECAALLDTGDGVIHVHALAESFATLTGGRLAFRLPPDEAHMLLSEDVLPFVKTVVLAGEEVMATTAGAKQRGIRGGAIHDFLHLAAARKIAAARIYTLNFSHFIAFFRAGDPVICHPAQSMKG